MECVKHFSMELAKVSGEQIIFPSHTAMINIKTAFYNIAGMPNVIGCVDGTFIKVIKPSENMHEFICRKGFAAINVQVT